jgi:transcriptional regulator with XRE-family HTH domain
VDYLRFLLMALTLRQYRSNLGWSVERLAQEARLTYYAVSNAEKGKAVRAATGKAIADALSRALGREILVSDIEGLNTM